MDVCGTETDGPLLCGAAGALHAHHVIPRSRGGGDEIGNLITLCPGCHRSIESGNVPLAVRECTRRAIQAERPRGSSVPEIEAPRMRRAAAKVDEVEAPRARRAAAKVERPAGRLDAALAHCARLAAAYGEAGVAQGRMKWRPGYGAFVPVQTTPGRKLVDWLKEQRKRKGPPTRPHPETPQP
jgi:hypothetical protein